jgi:hypothetical protein
MHGAPDWPLPVSAKFPPAVSLIASPAKLTGSFLEMGNNQQIPAAATQTKKLVKEPHISGLTG